MAPLPKGFSLQALPISAAIAEGRTKDAERLTYDILNAGNADKVVQKIAADMIRRHKRPRGRKKSLPQFWLQIGEQFSWLRSDGVKYEDALRQVADEFGYSETHVRKAIKEYDDAREASEDATRELYEEWEARDGRRK
ncbi:hypothetical protein [Manganibacter manganicus]|uniref:Uncharacterized protein n=1 Tax=Manganibacter manganicus TaxID=1873176 RepID=A0A1V8RWK1_9HYPH|nr:hypothetical protein [Pseudaminobacter manganicus]OQM77558.1 hypothetical protein BFN67_01605 [Pseudaminobacter manganicus]